MTTITLMNGTTIQVEAAHLNRLVGSIFAGNSQKYDAYKLSDIKSIIPPKMGAPTYQQTQFTHYLQTIGYDWDKQHSAAAPGVILKRADGDFWFFGMQGEIMHNPDGITIKL